MTLRRRDVLHIAAAAALSGCAGARREGVAAFPVERGHAMNTRPLMTLRLTTAATQDLGVTPQGKRVTFSIVGGEFEGERLRGKVLPGGADWTVQRPDGAVELDLRVTLETDDGALVQMTFTGLRDDGHAYFHTLPRFETAAPKYAFLNRLLAVGTGEIRADGPRHVIEEIL
jgi:Protein of unknown function (DUF3237)